MMESNGRGDCGRDFVLQIDEWSLCVMNATHTHTHTQHISGVTVCNLRLVMVAVLVLTAHKLIRYLQKHTTDIYKRPDFQKKLSSFPHSSPPSPVHPRPHTHTPAKSEPYVSRAAPRGENAEMAFGLVPFEKHAIHFM